MIIAKSHYWADHRTAADLIIDSQPDGTYAVRWGSLLVGTLTMEGRTLTGTIQGSRMVVEEIPDARYPVALGNAALGLICAAMDLANNPTKDFKATLDGSTITITRDGEEIGSFAPSSDYGRVGWKGKLLGRPFSPHAQTQVRRVLESISDRLKKAGQPDWYIRDATTGAFYKGYTEAESDSKAREKASRAILKERDAKVDARRFQTDMKYSWDYTEETNRMVRALLREHPHHGPVLNMADPKKGPVGAKKFKRFSDAKMHLLYLVGHFTPSREARADSWPEDYDEVPEFLMNDHPVKIPASWEIVEVAAKGATPEVVMASAEIQDYVERHTRLKVLTDRYGSVVKAVYGKLEKDGKVEEFPYVLLVGEDDNGAIDAAIASYGIGKKDVIKVRGKERRDGGRKTAVATGDTSTAFILRSALSNSVPTQVINMVDLTEAAQGG